MSPVYIFGTQAFKYSKLLSRMFMSIPKFVRKRFREEQKMQIRT